jgi:histidine triad (HIT) family protein
MIEVERRKFDVEAYAKRASAAAQSGTCFICELVKQNPKYKHEIVYEDEEFIAFLDKYPTLLGKTIVSPKRHVEHVVSQLSLQEFQRLMSIVHKVARAVQNAVPTERVYLLSLGSQQANSHLHWHIAALPPGVPYEQQQYHALMSENGVLADSPEKTAAIANHIRLALSVGNDD